MKLMFSVLLVAVFSANAHAIFDDNRASKQSWINDLVATGLADVTDYQIGDEFGKRPVTREDLKNKGEAYTRAALATARFGGATSFYLGKIGGHHMMATNYHVLPDGRACTSRVVTFPILQKRYPCTKFYGNWSGIDLALFSIDVPAADEETMARVGRNFAFGNRLRAGQELVTIGFGAFSNPERKLVGNDDADCRVYSASGDARFIADPDRINPADYKAWSFSTGCDVSHGDSGSAMVDRLSGEVVGIIWTTATQKPERIRSSSYLDGALRSQHADVWAWLSFGVPAFKIKDVLEEYLASSRFQDPDVPQTLRAVLDARR